MTAQPPKTQSQKTSVVVADTGPLLCVGALDTDGFDLLRRRFVANGIDVIEPATVHDELYNRSLKNDALGIPALRAYKSSLLKVDNRQLNQSVRDVLRKQIEAEVIKRAQLQGRTVTPDPNANGGEIDAIMVAKHENSLLLCNERPARKVATGLGLTVVTFAHLLRAAMAEGEIAAADVDQYLKRLPPATFDIGIKNPTSLTINSLPEIPGL